MKERTDQIKTLWNDLCDGYDMVSYTLEIREGCFVFDFNLFHFLNYFHFTVQATHI